MYNTHTTKDGQTLLICQMTNSHLVNTIRILCNKIKSGRLTLENPQLQSQMVQVLSNFPVKPFTQNVIRELKTHHNHLQEYVLEAALRGLDITGILQGAYGRSKEPLPNTFPMLLEASEGEDDGGYENGTSNNMEF